MRTKVTCMNDTPGWDIIFVCNHPHAAPYVAVCSPLRCAHILRVEDGICMYVYLCMSCWKRTHKSRHGARLYVCKHECNSCMHVCTKEGSTCPHTAPNRLRPDDLTIVAVLTNNHNHTIHCMICLNGYFSMHAVTVMKLEMPQTLATRSTHHGTQPLKHGEYIRLFTHMCVCNQCTHTHIWVRTYTYGFMHMCARTHRRFQIHGINIHLWMHADMQTHIYRRIQMRSILLPPACMLHVNFDTFIHMHAYF